MRSQATFFLLSAFQLITFVVNGANLRSNERDLTYGYDDTVVADDDTVITDDDVGTNTTSYNTTATVREKFKNYTVSHMQNTYQSVPSEWSGEQWAFFAALMFIFGSIASCGCLFVVFPCCCPTAMTTAYARFLNPPVDEKKVKLIKI
jgi:hypothetical protein